MQLPAKNASSQAHLDVADHLDGAVEAWRDVEIITQDQQIVVVEVGDLVRGAADGLRARMATTEQAATAASKARARFGVRDVVLDLRVMSTSDGVLNGPALRDRRSPVFKQVFPDGNATEIARAKMREEPDLAGRLHERLGKAADFNGRAALLADLGEAVDKSKAARQVVVDAEEAETRAAEDERLARLELRHALEKGYGKLLSAFPGRKPFVESFFPKREASGTPEAAPAKAAPAPAPAAPAPAAEAAPAPAAPANG